MRKKCEYIVTYENGSQKTFQHLYEIELCCELTRTEIIKVIKSGNPTYDNVVNQKIWIEEMV